MELCKTDQPQWITIRWTLGMPNSAYNVHMMESILNNFNFDYVYKYLFGSTKITESYKPLRSPGHKEQAASEIASNEAKAAATDKNIFFFDDFSTNALNKPVNNWNSSLRNGKKLK
ncbi:MAG: hypothetical protein IPK57_10760 [Chitinophagaceae bacterium]|nr:hypothetical protein [Chitinophagaceae bacterium]